VDRGQEARVVVDRTAQCRLDLLCARAVAPNHGLFLIQDRCVLGSWRLCQLPWTSGLSDLRGSSGSRWLFDGQVLRGVAADDLVDGYDSVTRIWPTFRDRLGPGVSSGRMSVGEQDSLAEQVEPGASVPYICRLIILIRPLA
jgi:hypothetical protein